MKIDDRIKFQIECCEEQLADYNRTGDDLNQKRVVKKIKEYKELLDRVYNV